MNVLTTRRESNMKTALPNLFFPFSNVLLNGFLLTILLGLALLSNINAQNSRQISSNQMIFNTCIDTDLIDENADLPTIIAPVCGCDGNTYPNAEVAQFLHGVTDWTDGPCTNACDLQLAIIDYQVDCNVGTACFLITGGIAPYTILLNNGTTQTTDWEEVCLDDLTPGQYNITISDTQGCSRTLVFDIPPINSFLDATITPVSCFEGEDGAIDLHLPVGLPLLFQWSGPNGFHANTEDIDHLIAGTYRVKLILEDGTCYTAAEFKIEQPTRLNLEINTWYPSCSGLPNGCAHVAGGTAPYQLWVFEGEINSNTNVVVDVNQPTPTVVGLDVSTNVELTNDGTITDTWCANGIEPGRYLVLVVDANGCYTFEIVNIEPIAAMELGAWSENVSCNGENDGKICFEVAGGIPPYSSALSQNTTSGNTRTDGECFENLPAGTYELIVWDATQCAISKTITIEEPNELVAEFIITSETCQEGVDGCLKVTGGTPEYKVWVFTCPNPNTDPILPQPVFNNDGTVDVAGMITNNVISFDPVNPTTPNGYLRCAQNIPAGTYYVLVADTNRCWTFITIEIPSWNGLQVHGETSPVSCFGGEDGAIELHVAGGTPPFEVVWQSENGMSGHGLESLKSLSAGTYFITVFDANQCSGTITLTVNQPDELVAEFTRLNTNCDGQVDGCLKVRGGTRPYHIWVFTCDLPGIDPVLPQPVFHTDGTVDVAGMDVTTNIDFEPIDPTTTDGYIRCAQNIPPGVYYVLIADANRCWTFERIEIEAAPEPLTAEFVITSEPYDDQVDGCLIIEGGNEPYRLWVFTCPNNDPTTNLPEPIISDDLTTATVDGMIASTDINIGGGVIVGNEVCAENIPAGVYYILVVDENRCWVFKRIEIETPQGLTVTGEVTNAGCDGATGAIDITVTGGMEPYFFQWSNGATTEDIHGLAPGVYTVQVYTSNDFCTAEATFEVKGSDGLELNFTYDPFGSFACVDPVGGNGDFHVEWIALDGGAFIEGINPFCIAQIEPGAYLVEVTGANGCTASEIFFIEQPICLGGVAIVDPNEINSGENTTFILFEHTALEVQWQFRTANMDVWIDIPGAISTAYVTPPINSGVDKEIEVRAMVICSNGNGEVLFSSSDILYVIGNPNGQESDRANDRELFNQPVDRVLDKAPLAKVFPTITNDRVHVDIEKDFESATNIAIFNMNGQVVDTRTFSRLDAGSRQTFDVSDYMKGMYMVTIRSNGKIETRRVIVDIE